MLKSNNCNINTKNGVTYITFPIFEKEGLNHLFSTRIGGVSTGRYSEMNLSYSNGDDKNAVDENFRRISEVMGVSPDSIIRTHQTHTVNVISVGKNTRIPLCDIDGIMTDEKGVTLCSTFADCVPLMFYDPLKEVIATSHSGWKGTVGEIGRITVEKMTAEYGCDPKNILAVIGPAICKNCYEVDERVAEKVKAIKYIDPKKVMDEKPLGKYMLDLKAVCEQTLYFAGILPENLLVSDICTACNSEYLHSHRATGGERGNLCAFLAL